MPPSSLFYKLHLKFCNYFNTLFAHLCNICSILLQCILSSTRMPQPLVVLCMHYAAYILRIATYKNLPHFSRPRAREGESQTCHQAHYLPLPPSPGWDILSPPSPILSPSRNVLRAHQAHILYTEEDISLAHQAHLAWFFRLTWVARARAFCAQFQAWHLRSLDCKKLLYRGTPKT